jgi:TRAP-type transport system small permease protein
MHPPTPPADVFDRVVSGGCRAVLWLSTSVIFVILAGNTVLRYAGGTSLQWGNEVPELLFPWLVMAGVVLAAQQGAHITTSFLMDALPLPWRRRVALLGWGLVAALYGTLSVATWGLLPVVHDEKSPILRLPGSLTYACVLLGMLLLMALALRTAWRTWRSAPEDQAPSDAEHPRAPSAHW